MFFKINKRYGGTVQSLNVIPLVDILFQLIIFFALVYRVVEIESFPVAVPDNCTFAQSQEQIKASSMTVTVMETARGQVEFAIGSEKISVSDYDDLPHKLGQMIDSYLKDMPSNARLVTLRVDKNICFGEVQYALAGIGESVATEIKLAAFKDKHGGEE